MRLRVRCGVMPAVGAYRGRRARNQGDSASALPLRALASTCGSCATSQHAASEARVSGRTAHTAQRAERRAHRWRRSPARSLPRHAASTSSRRTPLAPARRAAATTSDGASARCGAKARARSATRGAKRTQSAAPGSRHTQGRCIAAGGAHEHGKVLMTSALPCSTARSYLRLRRMQTTLEVATQVWRAHYTWNAQPPGVMRRQSTAIMAGSGCGFGARLLQLALPGRGARAGARCGRASRLARRHTRKRRSDQPRSSLSARGLSRSQPRQQRLALRRRRCGSAPRHRRRRAQRSRRERSMMRLVLFIAAFRDGGLGCQMHASPLVNVEHALRRRGGCSKGAAPGAVSNPAGCANHGGARERGGTARGGRGWCRGDHSARRSCGV